MKKIIKNALYNTDTARLLTSAIERNNPFLPEETEVSLYRKKNGEYFYHQKPKEGDEKIIPTTRSKAKQWLLSHFSEEDTENILMPLKTRTKSKVKMLIPFDPVLKAEMMAAAEELGMTQNDFIFSCVRMGIKAQKYNLGLAKITDKDFENIKVFIDDRPESPFA